MYISPQIDSHQASAPGSRGAKRTRMQPLKLALMADARPLIGLLRPVKPTVCHGIVHDTIHHHPRQWLTSIKLPPVGGYGLLWILLASRDERY